MIRPDPGSCSPPAVFVSTEVQSQSVSCDANAIRRGSPPAPSNIANRSGVTTTPVKNGAVYACIQNPVTGGVVGGVLGAADGGNTIAPANSYFTGPQDANGNVEVAFQIN